jgi:hypothetical protein
MVKAVLILGSILLSGAAHASQVTCTGQIAGYNLVLRAQMQGARFVSKVNLVVSQGPTVLKQLSMKVITSHFVVGQKLDFTAQDANGKIVVTSQFAGGHNYSGNVDASGAQGNISVSGVCVVR